MSTAVLALEMLGVRRSSFQNKSTSPTHVIHSVFPTLSYQTSAFLTFNTYQETPILACVAKSHYLRIHKQYNYTTSKNNSHDENHRKHEVMKDPL